MPFRNEHASRLQNPDKFDDKSFRRNDSPIFGKKLPVGVEVIWGKIEGKSAPADPVIPQSIRFPKDKYTVAQAKKWLSDNEINYILFEPALKESDFRARVEEQISNIHKALNKLEQELQDGEMEESIKCTFDRSLLSDLKESNHKRDQCMMCSVKPIYDVVWANGHGRAWFCEQHFKDWSTNGDGKDDIVYVKEVKDGEVDEKFADNRNPNIWDESKNKFKEEKVKEQAAKFTLRWHWVPDTDSRFELLINTGKESLDRWDFSGDVIKQNETQAVKKSMNVPTPNGGSFEEWMMWEGSIPGKDVVLHEIEIIKEIEKTDNGTIYMTKNGDRGEHLSKPTRAKFGEGQKAWMDEAGNIYTGNKGGTAFGNPYSKLPAYIEIKDSGDVEIVEDTNQIVSFKFNGKIFNGMYVMRKESANSNTWIFSKGQVVDEEKKKETKESEEEITSTEVPKFIDMTGYNAPIEIKLKNSEYQLISTKNGKLILNRK